MSDGLVHAEVLTVSDEDPREQWILDTGCTFYMTPMRDWLFDFDSSSGGKVLMGNNQSCRVEGTGSIRLKTEDNTVKILKEVRHIPDLKINLISLGVFDKAGYNYRAQCGVIKIHKGIMMVLKGKLINGLYVLQAETVTGEAEPVQSESEVDLWHKRLGHMSQTGIQELCKQELIHIKDPINLEFCENCVLGKAHKLKFPKAIHRTKGTLDYIHSDLYGAHLR